MCFFLGSCGTSTTPPRLSANPATKIATTQNPLVAAYFIVAGGGGTALAMVEFGTTTAYGRQTAWYPLSGPGGSGAIYVAGMRASTTYHMKAHVKNSTSTWESDDRTFTTGPLPPSLTFPTLTVTRPNPSLTSTESPGIEELNLVTFFPQPVVQALFADRDGNPIWYYDVGGTQGNYPSGFRLIPNGDIIFVINNIQTNATVSLREVDLAGNIVHELTVPELQRKMQRAGFSWLPGGFSHDVIGLPNGHLILIAATTKNFTDLPGYAGTVAVAGDGLVDLDSNWNPVWAWNSFDHLDVNRHLNGLPDWTHANAVVYSPSDGNLLFSLRHQAWILKIDYKDGAGPGDILWRLGNEGDFSLAGDDPSQWFFFQHAPSIVSQQGSMDTIAIWDNGNARPLSNSDPDPNCGANGGSSCYSRATVFQIDESSRIATLQWADAPGYFSFWGGSCFQMANGTLEFDMTTPAPPPETGVLAEIQEVTQSPIPQIVWKMDIGLMNAYRGYRVPSLYPDVTWNQ